MPRRKGWGEAFAEGFAGSFSKGMEMAQQAQRMKQLKEMNQMHYDATLGSKGFRRMDEDQAKEYMSYLASKGVPVVGGGYAGLPEGAELKNGEIFDSEGNNIGSYLEGNEPQKIKNQIDQYPEGVVRVGSNFYKYDEDLAMKMRGKNATPQIDIEQVKKELGERGLKGNLTPFSLDRAGNVQTWRYNSTAEEKMGVSQMPMQPVQSPVQGQVQAPVMQNPINQQISNTAKVATLDEWRSSIKNAIEGGETRENILAAIKRNKLKEKDFEDLLYAYEPNIPPMRRQILGSTLRNVGISPVSSLNYMGALSGAIDRYKNRMRNK